MDSLNGWLSLRLWILRLVLSSVVVSFVASMAWLSWASGIESQRFERERRDGFSAFQSLETDLATMASWESEAWLALEDVTENDDWWMTRFTDCSKGSEKSMQILINSKFRASGELRLAFLQSQVRRLGMLYLEEIDFLAAGDEENGRCRSLQASVLWLQIQTQLEQLKPLLK